MEFLFLLLLILVNGLFAMSEMAVVSSRKTRLQQWADEGKSGTARLPRNRDIFSLRSRSALP